jgi:hypothetical protein
MFDCLTLDSSNSSIPPSSDPNRKKDSKENDENEFDSNTPGGQLGHPGKTPTSIDSIFTAAFLK